VVTLRRPVRGCGGRVFSRAVLRNRSGSTSLALDTRCAVDRGGQLKAGGPCVQADEATITGDDGPPTLDPALFGIAFTLDASLDGIDDDGSLPLDIGAVCGVPPGLASDAAKLSGLSGVALLTDSTEIWTCPGSADEAGADDGVACTDDPGPGGTRINGDEATTALDGADTAFVGVELLPRADWRQDEDGAPVPTFGTAWVKITD
jgi:hypothetical protein